MFAVSLLEHIMAPLPQLWHGQSRGLFTSVLLVLSAVFLLEHHVHHGAPSSYCGTAVEGFVECFLECRLPCSLYLLNTFNTS